MATSTSSDINLKKQLYSEVGTSNRPLSDREEHLVRGMLSHSLQTVNHLNSEISRLQSLCKMEVEQIERYHLALSPHKKVPPEVLTQIFSHCVKEGPIGRDRRHNDMPWVLLRVCSQWREVVKQAAFLTFQMIRDKHGWRTAHAIYSTFYNSKLDLLSSSWTWVRSGFVTNIVMPFASRIVRLTLTFSADRNSSSELPPILPDISFASLETLKLCCGTPPPAAIIEILRRSPALVEISLLYNFTTLSVTDLDDTESIVPIVLPNLHSIDFTAYGGSQTLQSVFFGAFMNLIIAPSLRHIRSGDMEQGILRVPDTYLPYGVIGSLVSRSSCSIDSLSLDAQTNEQELTQLLRMTPSLRSLSLGDGDKLSGSTLDAMVDGRLLPQLEILECHIGDSGTLHSIVDLLIKRASAGSGLRGYVVSAVHWYEIQDSRAIVDTLNPAITESFGITFMTERH